MPRQDRIKDGHVTSTFIEVSSVWNAWGNDVNSICEIILTLKSMYFKTSFHASEIWENSRNFDVSYVWINMLTKC